jgi:protoheme IX farnesyltransferase
MATSVLAQNDSKRIAHFFALLKFRLSLFVVFSGLFGYFIAEGTAQTDWKKVTLFTLGSFLITAAANIINQMMEVRSDKLMKRTEGRPLPTGKVSIEEALILTVVMMIVGSALLFIFVNPLTAALTLFSLILYAFVYTPLKQISTLAVFVGAFPGALPPLIGWVAARGELHHYALLIFAVQFIWQFPHFWAIAWLGDEDYTRAGLKMLPKSGKSPATALQILTYNLFLVPIGLMPWYFGLSGIVSAIVATLMALLFMLPALELIRTGERKAALKLMFASFFYLPVVQIAYYFDRLI